eukprot:Selendium_serpulae@DN5051_c0_g1_i11.p1
MGAPAQKHKVAIIGSGNWGSSISKVIAENTAKSDLFEDEVRGWVFEEQWNGKNLSDVINETHENPKYLPGVTLPSNFKGVPDIVKAAEGATLLVFVLPHQFIEKTCKVLKGKLAPGALAISLIKGIRVVDGKLELLSEFIKRELGVPCSVLSGANVAPDIAHEEFSETTIAYSSLEAGKLWQELFDRPYFRVNCLPDIRGVETCGAVKNIIALAAGFCDGLGYGSNTKAAIIRLGVMELKGFCLLFGGAEEGIVEETFFDSAGWADVITTCFGGRHVKVAAAFARAAAAGTPTTWDKLENEMLKGMKLQGQLTCQEVYSCLKQANSLDIFPLFKTTYAISFEEVHPQQLIKVFEAQPKREIIAKAECTPTKFPSRLRSFLAEQEEKEEEGGKAE